MGDGLNFESFAFSAAAPQHLTTYIAKFDYNVNDRNRIFVRGNLQGDGSSGAPQFPGGIPGFTTTDNTKGIAAGDTWAISNNWVNSARYQFSRQGYSNVAGAVGNFSTLSGSAPEATGSATFTFVPVHNFVDDVSWTKGAHTIQFGANFRRVDVRSITNSTSFNAANNNWAWLTGDGIAGRNVSLDPEDFNFPVVADGRTLMPQNIPEIDFRPTYNDAVSSLTGLLPEEFYYFNYAVAKNGHTGDLIPNGTSLTRDFRDNEFEYYVQDSWRIRPNLTLTFGLRHSLPSATLGGKRPADPAHLQRVRMVRHSRATKLSSRAHLGARGYTMRLLGRPAQRESPIGTWKAQHRSALCHCLFAGIFLVASWVRFSVAPARRPSALATGSTTIISDKRLPTPITWPAHLDC